MQNRRQYYLWAHAKQLIYENVIEAETSFGNASKMHLPLSSRQQEYLKESDNH